MRPQKEDLVDRCKMEAGQPVESKHTNRGIAFLCAKSAKNVRISRPFGRLS